MKFDKKTNANKQQQQQASKWARKARQKQAKVTIPQAEESNQKRYKKKTHKTKQNFK